jgi:hypothetical protein
VNKLQETLEVVITLIAIGVVTYMIYHFAWLVISFFLAWLIVAFLGSK